MLTEAFERERNRPSPPMVVSEEWYRRFFQDINKAFFGIPASSHHNNLQEAVRDAQEAIKKTWEAGEWYRQVSASMFRELLTGIEQEYSDYGRFLSTLLCNIANFPRKSWGSKPFFGGF